MDEYDHVLSYVRDDIAKANDMAKVKQAAIMFAERKPHAEREALKLSEMEAKLSIWLHQQVNG